MLKPKIGNVDLLICLDSGNGNYEQFWITSSLRGGVKMDMTVSVLENAVHSGMFSGSVPDPLRVLRILLSRLED